MYDVIIIGGGPGGVAAGVYAARKKMKALLITDSFGGQSLVSADIQNWIGTPHISGFDLAKSLEEHLRAQEGMEIMDNDTVEKVEDADGGLKVATKSGKTYETRYLLIASGSRRKKLNVPGEHELDGKGVAYCSICDAPLFKDKAVAVVGGGNAGLEAVIDLLPYASKITILEYNDALRGDAVTQDKIRANEKVSVIFNAQTAGILGDKMVTGLEYADRQSKEVKRLDVQGVFVEIGAIPNTEFVKGLVELDQAGEIVADPRTQKTSHPRIWAVGDATNVIYKQNNISVGDGVKAILNIYETVVKAG